MMILNMDLDYRKRSPCLDGKGEFTVLLLLKILSFEGGIVKRDIVVLWYRGWFLYHLYMDVILDGFSV